METTTPRARLVGQMQLDRQALLDMLREDYDTDWRVPEDCSDNELMVEVMGRLCYLSFGTDLNDNITRVRDGNATYVEHLIRSGHGSVLEHAWTSWVFVDVSRVLTHELVRHRAGTAVSQESGRFVRPAAGVRAWVPSIMRRTPALEARYVASLAQGEALWRDLLTLAEGELGALADLPFSERKELTSAARRVLPEGRANQIGWSANFRTLRHVISERTAQGAEEEIRLLFDDVARQCVTRWPHAFGDLVRAEDGTWGPTWRWKV